jgi:hypothetical protein
MSRGIRHLFLLRFAPRYRGQSEDAMKTRWPPGWRRWFAAEEREPGLEAGLQVFSVALATWWQNDAGSATGRRLTRD